MADGLCGSVRVVLGAGECRRRSLLAALTSTSGLVVVGQSVDADDLVASVGELSPGVVVADLADQVFAAPTVLGQLLLACVGLVVVTGAPVRERVLGWLRAGVCGVVAAEDVDLLGVAVSAAGRGQSFVSPAAATAVVAGAVWPDPPLLVAPTLAHARSVLTVREAAVLRELAAGLSTAKAAAELGMSEATLRRHLHAVLGKLDVADRAGAVSWAYRSRFC